MQEDLGSISTGSDSGLFQVSNVSIENLRNRKVTSNVKNKCSKCFKSILKLTIRSNWHFGIILRLFWVCFSKSTLKTTAYGLFHDLCHQLWRFGDIAEGNYGKLPQTSSRREVGQMTVMFWNMHVYWLQLSHDIFG